MRLWHKDFIDVLPRQQLLSQLRECVSIAKNIHKLGKPNHILVNPIMNYPIEHFLTYIRNVIHEMRHRGYIVRNGTVEKLESYIGYDSVTSLIPQENIFEEWHNETYLDICFYNLFEKFKCGGISNEEFQKIYDKYWDLKNWTKGCAIKVRLMPKYCKE